MRMVQLFASAIVGLLVLSGTAMATPLTTLTPLHSNGTDMYAVYIFSSAANTLNLSETSPNSYSNFFCNYSNSACTASQIGQTVYLGPTDPGIVFSLTDVTVPNTYTTNALASDGYVHDKVSPTVSAADASAVAAAYSIFGQGALAPAAAASIASLGQMPGTSITFVGWEDTLYGDFDYNDMIFAFTDPPAPAPVPEPMTIAVFGFGLLALAGLRWRRLRN